MSGTIDLQAMIAAAELSTIDYHHIYAGRARSVSASSEAEETVEPRYSINVARQSEGGDFRVKLRTDIDSEIGNISVEVGAEYHLNGMSAHDIDEPLMLDFVNSLAVMTMVPYLRSAVSDITGRVFNSSLLMPVIRRGELVFGGEGEEPAGLPRFE